MKHKRLSNVDNVEVVKMIKVESIVGDGTEENPVTKITEYFDMNGNRLIRLDINQKPVKGDPSIIHEWK